MEEFGNNCLSYKRGCCWNPERGRNSKFSSTSTNPTPLCYCVLLFSGTLHLYYLWKLECSLALIKMSEPWKGSKSKPGNGVTGSECTVMHFPSRMCSLLLLVWFHPSETNFYCFLMKNSPKSQTGPKGSKQGRFPVQTVKDEVELKGKDGDFFCQRISNGIIHMVEAFCTVNSCSKEHFLKE